MNIGRLCSPVRRTGEQEEQTYTSNDSTSHTTPLQHKNGCGSPVAKSKQLPIGTNAAHGNVSECGDRCQAKTTSG